MFTVSVAKFATAPVKVGKVTVTRVVVAITLPPFAFATVWSLYQQAGATGHALPKVIAHVAGVPAETTTVIELSVPVMVLVPQALVTGVGKLPR
jgi:hypothetical protein